MKVSITHEVEVEVAGVATKDLKEVSRLIRKTLADEISLTTNAWLEGALRHLSPSAAATVTPDTVVFVTANGLGDAGCPSCSGVGSDEEESE